MFGRFGFQKDWFWFFLDTGTIDTYQSTSDTKVYMASDQCNCIIALFSFYGIYLVIRRTLIIREGIRYAFLRITTNILFLNRLKCIVKKKFSRKLLKGFEHRIWFHANAAPARVSPDF